MRVLWLCNIILPAAAKQMGVEASSKEGWLSGLADVVLAKTVNHIRSDHINDFFQNEFQ